MPENNSTIHISSFIRGGAKAATSTEIKTPPITGSSSRPDEKLTIMAKNIDSLSPYKLDQIIGNISNLMKVKTAPDFIFFSEANIKNLDN